DEAVLAAADAGDADRRMDFAVADLRQIHTLPPERGRWGRAVREESSNAVVSTAGRAPSRRPGRRDAASPAGGTPALLEIEEQDLRRVDRSDRDGRLVLDRSAVASLQRGAV